VTRRSPWDIDFKHLADIVVTPLLDRSQQPIAGVVHENVDPAKPGECFADISENAGRVCRGSRLSGRRRPPKSALEQMCKLRSVAGRGVHGIASAQESGAPVRCLSLARCRSQTRPCFDADAGVWLELIKFL